MEGNKTRRDQGLTERGSREVRRIKEGMKGGSKGVRVVD